MKHFSRKMAALGIMILVASSSIIVGMGKIVGQTNAISVSRENGNSATLSPLSPPTKPIHTADGSHVWDNPGDITPYSKGIGILDCTVVPARGDIQTFTTNSTNPYNGMYYQFYWGDGTSSVVGPYNAGQVATGTHDYKNFGFFTVTATVMLGAFESLPSPALTVRMYIVGDTNPNNDIGFDDINPFVLMLSSGKTAYYNQYPNGYFYTGDVNDDGLVGFPDINPFVNEIVNC